MERLTAIFCFSMYAALEMGSEKFQCDEEYAPQDFVELCPLTVQSEGYSLLDKRPSPQHCVGGLVPGHRVVCSTNILIQVQ